LKGTIRKNKIEIPELFWPNKTRAVGSTLFAFKHYLTLCSFVPKKNKAVIMLSSKHHEKEISSIKDKPQVIIDYNKMKGI
jgi:hypothetical protein